MGRKCKLTPETQDKLLMFIRDGLNLRDACYGADVGVSSFHRWRNLFPDFDKAVNQATSRQWESSLALAKYGCRKYKRKFYMKIPISARKVSPRASTSLTEHIPKARPTSRADDVWLTCGRYVFFGIRGW